MVMKISLECSDTTESNYQLIVECYLHETNFGVEFLNVLSCELSANVAFKMNQLSVASFSILLRADIYLFNYHSAHRLRELLDLKSPLESLKVSNHVSSNLHVYKLS